MVILACIGVIALVYACVRVGTYMYSVAKYRYEQLMDRRSQMNRLATQVLHRNVHYHNSEYWQ